MNKNDISIIIQGPTKYYKDIIGVYSNLDNVLWCTWEDEPSEVISFIREVGIIVYLISKPNNSGYWNVNFQCKSTYEGLLKSKELFNTKYYIKIRSDFQITNISSLCDRFILKNEEINFLGWANMLDGFFLDYIVFGDFINMTKYWEFNDQESNGYPCPEVFLMNRYFNMNLNSNFITKEFNSKFPFLNDINIYWLSRGINLRDFSEDLYLNYDCFNLYYYFKFKLKKIFFKLKF